jgi:hypothetical protein
MEKGATEVSTNGEHNLGIESLNLNSEEEATLISDTEEADKNRKSETCVRVAPRVSVEGPVRSNRTVPQPFALATEKRGSRSHLTDGAVKKNEVVFSLGQLHLCLCKVRIICILKHH